VTPLDQKSIVAIEKLIGQSIPHVEGGSAVEPVESTAAGSGDDTERPRHSRGRDGAREGSREGSERFAPRTEAAARTRTPAFRRRPQFRSCRKPRGVHAATPAALAHAVDRPPKAPAPRDAHQTCRSSHLPAFLLRPVRVESGFVPNFS
jgi:hypothetical protein